LITAKDFTTVWAYQGGKWVSATLSKGKLSGSLTTMQDGVGYWIYMTKADKLNVVGYVIAPAPASPPAYSLSSGWNLVGYKPQPDASATETVSKYLSSISGDYSAVWIYDNPSGTWIRGTGSTQIQVGDALWVCMTTPATLRP